MYNCTLIDKVDDTIFESIYQQNKTKIDLNMGFAGTSFDTDEKKIELMKINFNENIEGSVLVQIAKQSDNEVVGYIKGLGTGTTLKFTNAVFRNDLIGDSYGNDLFIDTHSFWKSLGFKELRACLVKTATEVVEFTKNECHQPELFQFRAEDEYPKGYEDDEFPDLTLVTLKIIN